MENLQMILMALAAVLQLWAIFDMNKRGLIHKFRLIWVLLIITCPIIGPIMYFQLKRARN